MKALLSLVCLLFVAGVAMAGSPPAAEPTQPAQVPCNLPAVAYNWDFADADHGFTTIACDSDGLPVWAYGTTGFIPGAPGAVWGTVLNANYPNQAGEGLVSPEFMVDNSAYLMEVYHWFQIENNYDGGNVSVNGTVITPMGGYTSTISTSTSYYAWCVDMEQGFTGSTNPVWRTDCWDLTALIGQTISVEFDFGSDSSVTYPGWYLASVKIGGEGIIPVEGASWGSIKNLYR